MTKFNTKQWAVLITAVFHAIMLLWFSYIRIDFDPDNKWNKIKMSFAEELIPEADKPEEKWIPNDYQEHGLDQKKASLAQTNEAVNEATEQLSKGEREQLEREIEAEVNQMAKDASTTGFMEGASKENMTGNVGIVKANGKKNDKKSGVEKGENDIGNVHDKSTNISYYLKNRTTGVIGLKNPVYLCQSGGVVVVNITVNTFGKVIYANVNDAKSNTKDACLRKEAKQAALKSTFNENENAATKQRGIITYVFSAQ